MGVEKVGDGVVIISRGDTFLTVWRERPTAERWSWFWRELRELLASEPDGWLGFSIVLATASPPSATVRSQIQRDFRALGPELRRFVVLPLGSSLWFNVVRAIVRGILLATGQSRLHAVVDSLRDGLDRLDECRGARTPSRAELQQMVEQACTALGVERLTAA